MPDLTFLGLTKIQWDFINGFAGWFSALGTILAVITSLWLANRSSRPLAKLSAGVKVVKNSGMKRPYPEYLNIVVVNHGAVRMRITQVGWKVGIFKAHIATQMIVPNTMSSAFPVELNHAEEANWYMPISFSGEDWYVHFAKRLLMTHDEGWLVYFPKYVRPHGWKIALRTLRVQVLTSTGAIFQARPESILTDKLRGACRALEQSAKEEV
jgi:hypothetical protein